MKNEDLDLKSAVQTIADFGGRRQRFKRSLWKAKWLPVMVMLVRWYGVYDFYTNPREIFMDYRENEFCILWFYLLSYVLMPYYMCEKATNHELCWKWKIPMMYLFAVNIVHLAYWSVVVTKDMFYFDMALIGFTLLLYSYVGIKSISHNSCQS